MTRTVPLIFASVLLLAISACGQGAALDVCTLLKSAKKHDGKTVIVTGFVSADQHSTAIGSEGCTRVVILRYARDSQPPDFISGVEDKRLKLDPRPFLVTVEGTFMARVCLQLGCISRIEVSRVRKSGFVTR
jgi:hypothetical protein